MSIASEISRLTAIRGDMRTALVAKGVDASTHDFADFPNDVESIPSGGGLPSEYEAVDYIESTGTQYINTGYTANPDDSCEIDLFLDHNFGNDFETIVGSTGVWSSNHFETPYLIGGQSGRLYNDRYSSRFYVSLSAQNQKGRIIAMPKAVSFFSLTGSSNAMNYTANSPLQSIGSLYIFADHHLNNAAIYHGKFRLYRLRIISNSAVIIKDYLPCKRKLDSKPGLYELVDNEFLVNQGTGEFGIPS